MTPRTVHRAQDVWTDMVVIASVMTHRHDDRMSVPDRRPTPTPTPPAEEESDRWVAQVLVECYNA